MGRIRNLMAGAITLCGRLMYARDKVFSREDKMSLSGSILGTLLESRRINIDTHYAMEGVAIIED